MNVIDISLLVLLGGFVLYGFWFGIIHMVGALIGVVFGAFAAGHFYGPVAAWMAPWFGSSQNLAKVVAFVLVFVLVNRLVGLAFWIVEKIFKFIAVIPFVKTFNRLLGAALGLLEGTLVIGLAVYFAARFPISGGFEALMKASSLAKAFAAVGAILAPLLPATVRAIQSVI